MSYFILDIRHKTTKASDEIILTAPNRTKAIEFGNAIVGPNNAEVYNIEERKNLTHEQQRRAIEWPKFRE